MRFPRPRTPPPPPPSHHQRCNASLSTSAPPPLRPQRPRGTATPWCWFTLNVSSRASPLSTCREFIASVTPVTMSICAILINRNRSRVAACASTVEKNIPRWLRWNFRLTARSFLFILGVNDIRVCTDQDDKKIYTSIYGGESAGPELSSLINPLNAAVSCWRVCRKRKRNIRSE